MFSMCSYFDPHTDSTLDAYRTSIVELQRGMFRDQDVDEAKLAVFGRVDAPSPPSRKVGAAVVLRGTTTTGTSRRYSTCYSTSRRCCFALATRQGHGAFLYGLTDAMRQEARDRLLRVSKADVVDAAEKYLHISPSPSSPMSSSSSVQTIVGTADAAVAFEHQGWTVRRV